MVAAINDLSFQYQMSSLAEAIERLKEFSDICIEIEKEQTTNIDKIVIVKDYDYTSHLAPNLVLPQIIKQFPSKDVQRYLMRLLTSRDQISEQEGIEPFCLDGRGSRICAYAKDDVVISLLSNPVFEPAILEGTCSEAPMSLYNLSQKGHIEIHKERLGVRRYHANAVKHKPSRVNAYGKGRQASPMDLDDETAQKLLNRAIPVNNRLYAKKDGKVYAFMEERPCIYHGYIDSEAPDFVLKELEKAQWD